MLKYRVMPTLLLKELTLVKGVRFDSWRRVGSVMQSVKVYNMREVDELVFHDITATREGHEPDLELVDEIADECFMPLTVGGGIRDVEDVRRLMRVGADKVSINTRAVEDPSHPRRGRGGVRLAVGGGGDRCRARRGRDARGPHPLGDAADRARSRRAWRGRRSSTAPARS